MSLKDLVRRAEVTDPYEGLDGVPEYDDTDDPRTQP